MFVEFLKYLNPNIVYLVVSSSKCRINDGMPALSSLSLSSSFLIPLSLLSLLLSLLFSALASAET